MLTIYLLPPEVPECISNSAKHMNYWDRITIPSRLLDSTLPVTIQLNYDSYFVISTFMCAHCHIASPSWRGFDIPTSFWSPTEPFTFLTLP